MAKQKKSDWKHLFAAGSIVLAVVGTLILGWALQADPADPAGQIVIEGSLPDHQFPSPAAHEEPSPPVETAPPVEPAADAVEPAIRSEELNARARQDLARMRAAEDRWTLQFASLCNRESVRRKLAALSGYDQFYLIPADVNDLDCHRLCWGLYRSREAALAARGIPRALSEIAGEPAAMPVRKVAQ